MTDQADVSPRAPSAALALLAASGAVAFRLDTAGRLTWASPSAAATAGGGTAALLGRCATDAWPELAGTGLDRARRDLAARGGSHALPVAGSRLGTGTLLLVADGDGTLALLQPGPANGAVPAAPPPGATRVPDGAAESTDLPRRLAESEARLRTVFEAIDEGYCLCEFLVDAEGSPYDYRFLEVNPLFETMTGLRDPVGRTALELVPNLERHWITTYARVAFGGERLRFEQESPAMGRWFDVFATPVEPRGRLAVVFRDITEQRRAADALRASEARYALAAEAVNDGIWDWNVATGEVRFSPRWASMLGYTLDEIEPHVRSWERIVHPDDLPGVMQTLTAHLEGRTPVYETEHRVRHKDGGWIWIRDRGKVVERDADGRPLRAVGTHTDISAQRQAEEERGRLLAEVQRERDLLRQVFAQTPSFVAVLRGPSHVVEFVNEPYLALVGRRPVVGRGLREALPEIEGQGFFELLDGVLATGQPVTGRAVPARLQRADGQPLEERIVDFVYQPILDADGGVGGVVVHGVDVTDAVRARQAVEAEREQLARLVDALPVMVTVYDPALATSAGGAVHFNRAFVEILGWTEEDARAGDLMALCYPDPAIRASAAAHMQRTDASGTAGSWLEIPTRAKDGRTVPVLWTNLRLSGDRQVGVGIDLTERKTAEAALADERALLQAVLAQMPIGVLIADAPSGRIRRANPEGERVLAHPVATASDVSEYGAYGALHADGTHAPTEYPTARALAGEVVDQHQMRYRRGDGRITHLSVSAAPVYDAEGRLVCAVCAWTDVDERIRLETTLREHQEQLYLALDAAAAGTWAWEVASGQLTWDTRCRDLHGLAPGETPTMDGWYALVHPDDRERVRTRLDAMARVPGDDQWRMELRIMHPQLGERWLLTLGRAERDASGQIARMTGINLDITDRRRTEQRVEAAQRMETAGRIAGGVAHEANNQMTVVLGAARFLQRRSDLAAEAQEDLEFIVRAAERTAGICQQLLAFSRRQVLRPEALAPDAVVRAMAPLLERGLGGRCQLTFTLDAPDAVVRADRGQLEQVLLNLALNARDAMPEGGMLTLASSRTTLDGVAIARQGLTLERGHYWTLAVRDTGVGMDAATRARIFEPFFTTKPVGQGTGLGLPVVQGVLRQSGGDIAVESVPGEGSTFRLFLPLAAPGAADHGDGGEGTAAAPPRAADVLLVEDEPTLRRLAERALRAAGFAVRSAADAEAALAMLGDGAGPAPDCLVTDVVMPGRSGIELAAQLRIWWPRLPVLYMSGHTDVIGEGIGSAERSTFVAKPFAPDELARAVAALLALDARQP